MLIVTTLQKNTSSQTIKIFYSGLIFGTKTIKICLYSGPKIKKKYENVAKAFLVDSNIQRLLYNLNRLNPLYTKLDV